MEHFSTIKIWFHKYFLLYNLVQLFNANIFKSGIIYNLMEIKFYFDQPINEKRIHKIGFALGTLWLHTDTLESTAIEDLQACKEYLIN